MAKIVGLDDISASELEEEIDRGATFVVYQYTISLLFLTLTRGTNIYFVRSDESRLAKGLPWTGLTLALGWWGFPFGLIFTPITVVKNVLGGKDVTDQVLTAMRAGSLSDAEQLAIDDSGAAR